MKIICILGISLFNINLYAQGCEYCNDIAEIDGKIYTMDTGLPAFNNLADKKETREKIRKIIEVELIPKLQFEDNRSFEAGLAMISHVETITWLELYMQETIETLEEIIEDNGIYPGEDVSLWKKRLAQIDERMQHLFEKNYTYYRFTASSKTWVKAIYAEHGNDILHLNSKYNDDRDLTGSFRFEIVTDQLKLRIFNGQKWWNMNSRSWYTYQTIFAAGEGYTPYLRDTSIFNSPTAIDSNDRPYASYFYYGFSKHRLFRNGMFKLQSRFKFGTIGARKPGGIQAFIHRDLDVGAYTPNGWDAQIANGGRFAFQYDLSHEYMLLSNGWMLYRGLRDKFDQKLTKFPFWVNLSVFDEIRVGYDMTSLGAGVRLSTNDFKRSGDYDVPVSGSRMPVSRRRTKYAVSLSANYQFRYVIHNSMLEGYGITGSLKDEDPATPVDVYVLQNNQIERLVHIFEWQLSIKTKYVNFIYKNRFMSPEFNLPVNNLIYTYGEDEVDGFTNGGNHNVHKWNHVGTIGLLFNVK